MTEITNGEIKVIFFAIVFTSLLSVFTLFYNLTPVTTAAQSSYDETTIVVPSTSISPSNWISGLLNFIPRPFNDPVLLALTLVMISPIATILSFIALRFAKDILTKWV